MSVVYLAYQESLKREVALKVMRPVIADESNVVKRFKQEAEIIAKLYHPNIVSIYDVGAVDNHILFYAMPYLQHGDLTGFAYHNDEELIKVMSGLCQGFAYAHAQGVVHRDIKPENILFDQFGNVKIADFGIALSSGKRRFTKDQRIVGSIHYLSPEQARSKHVDARSDIYGLGAILYEVLTGKPVFDAPDDLGIMMAHVENPVPRLPKKVAHWQPIIDRCLAKSPNQRFQSMPELQKATEQLTPQLKQGPVRRLNAWPYLLVSVLLVSVLLVAVMTGGWLWSNRDKLVPESVLRSSDQNPESKNQPPFIRAHQSPPKDTETQADTVAREPLLSEQATHDLLNRARENIQNKQLTTPDDNNALDKLLQVLADQPRHEEARALLSEINDGYFELAYQAVLNRNYALAEQFAESLTTVRHKVALVNESLLQYLAGRSEMTVSLLLGSLSEQVNSAVRNNNRALATRLVALTDVFVPGHRLVDELNELVAKIPESGQVIKDQRGIKAVLVTPSSGGAVSYGFYATATEITQHQYRQFVQATHRPLQKCKSVLKSNLIFSSRNLDNVGFPYAGDMPAVCVSWQDARDYAQWLSKETGHNYRLPTRDEWQVLAVQSGGVKRCGQNNLAGTDFPDKNDGVAYYDCDDGYPHLAPVRALGGSDTGLFGIHGNAAEWLDGCEAPGKIKSFFAPEKPCGKNPVAGLSWLSDQRADGDIQMIDYGDAYTHIGFRLVRE